MPKQFRMETKYGLKIPPMLRLKVMYLAVFVNLNLLTPPERGVFIFPKNK
ncbi:hypothetical protein DESHY_20156 [Desulforamulus hydrothermalis Lam5 = DSM 18033]|uniref:Uncharacterized protein n=1 Tax=Desulforamulus hydrothermalis Lam5 = DSM 18033 TaxID=1121428 RepID=K8DZ48_9FIRM|nr:hypothetical protein DESHY_20156 [Desulforamulus hydrothermalis Lam5 = DSM 18033]